MDFNLVMSGIMNVLNWLLEAMLLMFNILGKILNWLFGLIGRIF